MIFIFLLSVGTVQARSGCCSHHGGVCGCRCCDGTSLSATCAPYYPSCNNQTKKTEIEETGPKINRETDNLNNFSAELPKESINEKENGPIYFWLIIIGIIIAFNIFRKKNN